MTLHSNFDFTQLFNQKTVSKLEKSSIFIDQGIHSEKNKVARNEKQTKKIGRFSYDKNMANFEGICQVILSSINLWRVQCCFTLTLHYKCNVIFGLRFSTYYIARSFLVKSKKPITDQACTIMRVHFFFWTDTISSCANVPGKRACPQKLS